MDPRQTLKELASSKGFKLNDPKFSEELDREDELREFRDRFHFPIVEGTDKEFLYFTGNSLGLQPKSTKSYIEEELEVWRMVTFNLIYHLICAVWS